MTASTTVISPTLSNAKNAKAYIELNSKDSYTGMLDNKRSEMNEFNICIVIGFLESVGEELFFRPDMKFLIMNPLVKSELILLHLNMNLRVLRVDEMVEYACPLAARRNVKYNNSISSLGALPKKYVFINIRNRLQFRV